VGGVEPEDDEGLVVPQHHVEARPVLLDELVLEEHRLLLGAGDDHLDGPEELVEERHEGPLVGPGRAEVGADAAAQAGGLAHVDHHPHLVLHEVAAWRGRQLVEGALEGGVHGGAGRIA